jgi:uncharacterized RDD family membrane protein YckC
MRMTSEPSHESVPPQKPEVVLARWSTRFWAWLVDFIIVMAAAEIIFSIAYAPWRRKICSPESDVLWILDVL